MKYKTKYLVMVQGSQFDYSYDLCTAHAMANCYKAFGWTNVRVIKSNKK